MEARMGQDMLALAPEALLAAMAVFGLLLGSFLPRSAQWAVRLVGLIAAAGVVITTLLVWNRAPATLFDGSYSVDVATNTIRIAVAVAVILVVVLAAPVTRGHARASEFVVLVLLGALGAILLAGASDLMLLVGAYLLAGIPLYALAGFGKDDRGSEATLKYYLLGALFGTVMLFGGTILFGVGGATAYLPLADSLSQAPRAAIAIGAVAVLGGLLFKAGGVPAHFWVPDVAQGSRPVVAAFVTTVPKLGAVVALLRLSELVLGRTDVEWSLLVAVIAAVTMTSGNLAAFFQTDVRRLLGYSTISQVGYLLIGVAAGGGALSATLLYLVAYALTNLGAFAVVCALPHLQTIDDYRGLLRCRPGLTIALVVCLLGLVGTPPTGVFVGKLTVFTDGLDAGLAWLVVLAAINTVASLFYYLRWITPTLSGAAAAIETSRTSAWIAYAAAAASVAVGLTAGPLLDALDGSLG